MYSILILLVHMTYSFNKLCYLLVISVAEALSVSLVNLFVCSLPYSHVAVLSAFIMFIE